MDWSDFVRLWSDCGELVMRLVRLCSDMVRLWSDFGEIDHIGHIVFRLVRLW